MRIQFLANKLSISAKWKIPVKKNMTSRFNEIRNKVVSDYPFFSPSRAKKMTTICGRFVTESVSENQKKKYFLQFPFYHLNLFQSFNNMVIDVVVVIGIKCSKIIHKKIWISFKSAMFIIIIENENEKNNNHWPLCEYKALLWNQNTICVHYHYNNLL